jgi:polysaccharide biosynthesis/export protein
MKVINLVKNVSLVLSLVFTANVFAQDVIDMGKEKVVIIKARPTPTPEVKTNSDNKTTTEPIVSEVTQNKTVVVEKPKEVTTQPDIDGVNTPETPKKDEKVLTEEEAAVLPYLDSYVKDYRLGPGDVLTIEVFGQCPNYCIEGKKVAPNGKFSFPLIPEGIFVVGKTQEKIQEEITKKLDEYIIDPKVTVYLEQAVSQKFGVFGKVTAPGIRVMDQRYSLYDAIAFSGGLAKDADKKRVTIFRRVAGGSFTPTTYDYDLIMKGKQPMPFLEPGDQVIVPEKKWSLNKFLGIIGQASAMRMLFGSPF